MGDEEEEALDDEARIMDDPAAGPEACVVRSGNGWRCGGGSHFVYDPILKFD